MNYLGFRRSDQFVKCSTALLLALVVLPISGCRSAPAPENSTPSEGEIALDFSADSEIAKHNPRATLIENLGSLPQLASGVKMFAAGRFEPSGLQIPAGLEVTWPLRQSYSPGERLWIAYLNEDTGQWQGTGEIAEVLESGDQATGTIYHFSVIGLSDQKPSSSQSTTSLMVLKGSTAADEDDEERRSRFYWHQSQVVEMAPGGLAEKVLHEYKTFAGNMTAESMAKLYDVAGGDAGAFKVVAGLIDKGLAPNQIENVNGLEGLLTKDSKGNDVYKISEDDNKVMADIRENRINDSIKATLLKFQSEGRQFRVARSDSGNLASGLKSDVDQTFYVEEYKKGLGWVRQGPEIDTAFRVEVSEQWGKIAPKISIESVDIAFISGADRFPDPCNTKISFASEFRRATNALRATGGAYVYEGAVAHQMQFRALGELISGNKRGYQVFELDENGQFKDVEFDYETAVRRMFGTKPELRPLQSFGAAMGNLMFLEQYLQKGKIDAKYHLRVWEDAMFPMHMNEQQARNKIEYTDVDETVRQQANDLIIDKMFSNTDTRRRHKLAMETSRLLRLKHKSKIESTEAEIYEALAKDMFAKDLNGASPTATHLEKAKAEHRRLAGEFCVKAVSDTAAEMFELHRANQHPSYKPDINLEKYKHWMTGIAEADKPRVLRQLGEAAEVTLLFSLYDLGPTRSMQLINQMQQRFPDMRLKDKLALWARGRVQPLEAFATDAAVRANLYEQQLKRVNLLAERASNHVWTELGWEKVKEGDAINRLLTDAGFKWSPTRLVRNAVWDPGSIDALAQVMLVYVNEHGDLDKTGAAILNELVLAVPVGGQFISFAQAAREGLLPGITNVVFVAGAMQFPVFGQALLVVSIGQAGYAMHEAEYAQHVRGNIVDGIYRGFVGPSRREFQQIPQFYENEQARLDEATRLRKDAWARKDYETSVKLADEIAKLTDKKAAAKVAANKEHWAGGFFTEAGAQLVQKRFNVPLFQGSPDSKMRFEPIISYSPQGILVFESNYDYVNNKPLRGYEPERDEPRIQELESQIQSATVIEEFVDASAELDELLFQKGRYEWAARYLDRAANKAHQDDAGTTPIARSKQVPWPQTWMPELMHKIYLDSLYPNLIRLTREGHLQGPNTDEFVDKWFELHGPAAARELVRLGLLADDWDVKELPGAAEIPLHILEQLKSRLEIDLRRSKALWQKFEFLEKQRSAGDDERKLRRIGALKAEAAGLFVGEISEDPKYKEMENLRHAMYASATPIPEPLLSANVWVHRFYEQDASGRVNRKQGLSDEIEIGWQIDIELNQRVYLGTYTNRVPVLTKSAAEKAIRTGQYQGIPLWPETRQALARIVPTMTEPTEANPDAEKSFVAIPSVFCEQLADMSMAYPATYKHLPGFRDGDKRIPELGYLVAQSVAYGQVQPGAEKAAPSLPQSVDIKVAYRPSQDAAADDSSAVLRDQPFTIYEPWDVEKADAQGTTWGGEEVDVLSPQLWICWEEAPLDHHYYYEMEVSGGVHQYQEYYSGGAIPRDSFPDDEQSSARENVFVFPFDWPKGHVGSFRLKGRICAFDRHFAKNEWRQAIPIGSVEFDELFEISDQRRATDVSFVASYRKRMPVGELSGLTELSDEQKERYTKYARDGIAYVEWCEPYDANKADLWRMKWGDLRIGSREEISSLKTQLHIRWKDVPPNLVYYYKMQVTGGAPRYESDMSDQVWPIDEFPPKSSSSGPGSDAFVINVPWTWAGGQFDIAGTLYALPEKQYSGDNWREERPVATLAFQHRFDLRNRSRFLKGTYNVTNDDSIYLQILLAYVQEGMRPVQISGDGKTVFVMCDERYYGGGYFPDKPSSSHWVNVQFPYGSSVMNSVTVSFMDYGEQVTLRVPLEPADDEPQEQTGADMEEAMQRFRREIAQLDAGEMNTGTLDALFRAYGGLASCHNRNFDYGQARRFTTLSCQTYEKKLKLEIAQRANDPAGRLRSKIAAAEACDGLYWHAVRWGNLADMKAMFVELMSQADAADIPAGSVAAIKMRMHKEHARNIFKLTGDLSEASSLWQASQKFSESAEGILRVSRRDSRPPVNPYEIDASFQPAAPGSANSTVSEQTESLTQAPSTRRQQTEERFNATSNDRETQMRPATGTPQTDERLKARTKRRVSSDATNKSDRSEADSSAPKKAATTRTESPAAPRTKERSEAAKKTDDQPRSPQVKPAQVAVPDVVGQTAAEAKAALARAGLKASFELGKTAKKNKKAFQVYRSKPKAGERVERGASVKLKLYAQPE